MVTKKQIKLVKGLQQKKYRTIHGLFVAEGLKLVQELLASDFKPFNLFVDDLQWTKYFMHESELITPETLKQMSSLHSPNGVLGVFEIPKLDMKKKVDWVLAVDAVRDPGNLGTIIRLCDWYGIGQLVCSPDTVDCYNPKVLQATMGSIARVQVYYEDLGLFLRGCDAPVFGAFMEGKSVFQHELPKHGILVMGNEANGISKAIEAKIDMKMGIPQFGGSSAESLNVATATAILLNEIRRDSFIQK